MFAKRLTKITAFLFALAIVAVPMAVSAQGYGNNGSQGNSGQAQARQQSQSQINSGAGMQNNNRQQSNNCMMDCPYNLQNTTSASVDVQLGDEVIAAMTAGLMDEYHAYATYQAVIDQFGDVLPFTRIQASEAQHIAAWQNLFERYGLEIPSAPVADATVTFASLSEACSVAASAEIANFGLYDSMVATLSDYPDMLRVVNTLRDASEFHHLPAFENCAR